MSVYSVGKRNFRFEQGLYPAVAHLGGYAQSQSVHLPQMVFLSHKIAQFKQFSAQSAKIVERSDNFLYFAFVNVAFALLTYDKSPLSFAAERHFNPATDFVSLSPIIEYPVDLRVGNIHYDLVYHANASVTETDLRLRISAKKLILQNASICRE